MPWKKLFGILMSEPLWLSDRHGNLLEIRELFVVK
jgi:hypothetical protein